MSDLKNPDGLVGPSPSGVRAVGVILPLETFKGGSIGTTTPVQNTLYLARYSPLVRAVITKISFEVTTLDAANPASEVVITDQLGNRRATSGSLTGLVNATGVQAVALASPLTIVPGDIIYAGFVTASAAVAALRCAVRAAAGGLAILGLNMPEQTDGTVAAVGTPVGANVGTALAGSTNFPLLGLRTD